MDRNAQLPTCDLLPAGGKCGWQGLSPAPAFVPADSKVARNARRQQPWNVRDSFGEKFAIFIGILFRNFET
jgi:hypothetical protein